jgi:hypothetical protein
MKYIVSIIAFLLYAQLFFAQIAPKARYLNVINDKNIRENTDQKNCLSCSENNFVIDGNESKGYVELEFNSINNYGQPNKIQLIMNIADVEYAESGDGFSVYYENEKIGSIQNVARNKSFVIELTPSSIAKHDKIKLVLKGNGGDGLYVLSKKSGFGAVLKLQY